MVLYPMRKDKKPSTAVSFATDVNGPKLRTKSRPRSPAPRDVGPLSPRNRPTGSSSSTDDAVGNAPSPGVIQPHKSAKAGGLTLPSNVVNHPSVTPPPDISTAPGGKGYKLKPEIRGARPPSIVSAVGTVAAQLTPENASANLSSPSSSTFPSAATEMLAKNSRRSSSRTMEGNHADMSDVAVYSGSSSSFRSPPGDATPTSSAGQNAETPTTSFSSPESSSSASPSRSTWTKLKPLSGRDAILHPVLIDNVLPSSKGKALVPTNAEHRWYLTFHEPWEKFDAEVLSLWKSEEMRSVFDKIKSYPMSPPRAAGLDVKTDSHGPELLASQFQRQVLEVVLMVVNKLLQTNALQGLDMPASFSLTDPAEADLGNNECPWTPSFVISASLDSGEVETRILGQIVYFDGKDGALTWAVQHRRTGQWASLRCVIGKSIMVGGEKTRY
jgi:hypothetical protein